jgi:hypothetical protein
MVCLSEKPEQQPLSSIRPFHKTGLCDLKRYPFSEIDASSKKNDAKAVLFFCHIHPAKN